MPDITIRLVLNHGESKSLWTAMVTIDGEWEPLVSVDAKELYAEAVNA